ncbi:hypothetical protein Dimus_037806 [Dionaea muscipula]
MVPEENENDSTSLISGRDQETTELVLTGETSVDNITDIPYITRNSFVPNQDSPNGSIARFPIWYSSSQRADILQKHITEREIIYFSELLYKDWLDLYSFPIKYAVIER